MTFHVQRNYKNGLFLMIFGNKPALLRLYNLMNGSNYTNPDDLIINTIEGVLYLGMKNDVSFIHNETQEACLECTVTMININYGHNKKLMDSCRNLFEYAFLIEEIRKNLRLGTPLASAVDQAVEICINEGILKTFLLRHRAEVKNVILEEFDWKKQIQLERKESYGEGLELGLERGREQGRDDERLQFAALAQKLMADSRIDDLTKAAVDFEYRSLLLDEYKLK